MLTDQQHPLTPPPELVQQLLQEHYSALPVSGVTPSESALYIATQAARWGADQELEACMKWMLIHLHAGSNLSRQLRVARRPKPPSLAEQGLAALKRQAVRSVPSLVATNDCEVIRRALERLQELESNG